MRHFSEEREKRRELAIALIEAGRGYGTSTVLEAIELAFRYRSILSFKLKPNEEGSLGTDYRIIANRNRDMRINFETGKDL